MRISNALPKQGLDRSLSLLDKLASGTSMSIGEICEYLNITKSTAYSMLQSFLSRHYVERDPETGKYSMGYKFYEYGMAYRYNFPFLVSASKRVQLTANKLNIRISVSILKEMERIVQILIVDNSPMPDMPWGYALPSYATGSGKTLLAYSNQDIVQQWLNSIELTQFTPSTCTDREALLKEFQEIRERGYAISRGGYNPNRTCYAAPIFDFSGKAIAAISFQVSLEDAAEREDLFISELRNLTSLICGDMGYNVFH